MTTRLLSILLLALTIVHARAEDTSDLTTRILEAQTLSSLDDPTLKPWHLKLAVQLYDFKGAPSEQGTIEEWWAAPNQHRVIYAFPSSQITLLETPAGKFRTKNGNRQPFQADDVLIQIVHPFYASHLLENATPLLHQQTFGKAPLDCVAFTPVAGKLAPISSTTNFCLTPESPVLRLIYGFGAQLTLRNAIGKFQGKQIATDVTLNYGASKNASGQVTTLATIADLDPALFTPTDDLVASVDPVAPLNAAVNAGHKIGGDQPAYPPGAKVQRLSGVVVLRALISREGQISELVPIYASDPVFIPASLTAVKTWTYKPYLLNGRPTEVDTTITVDYTMGR